METLEKYLSLRPLFTLAVTLSIGIFLALYFPFLPGIVLPLLLWIAGIRWLQKSIPLWIILSIAILTGYTMPALTLLRIRPIQEQLSRVQRVQFQGQLGFSIVESFQDTAYSLALTSVNGKKIPTVITLIGRDELCSMPSGCPKFGDVVEGEARITLLGTWVKEHLPAYLQHRFVPVLLLPTRPAISPKSRPLFLQHFQREGIQKAAQTLAPEKEGENPKDKKENKSQCESDKHPPICDTISIFLGKNIYPPAQETKENFRKSGLTHLIVPSASNLSISLFLLILLAGYLRIRRFFVVPLAIFLTFMMSIFLGGIPIYRAFLTGLLLILGFAIETQRDALNSLGFAISVLLILDPFLLLHPSLQLSFSASLGMAVLSPPLFQFLKNIPKLWQTLLGFGLPSQIFLIPGLMYYFGSVPLLSPLANILVVPVAAVVTPLGLTATLLSFLPPPFSWLSMLLFLILKPFLWWVLTVANFFARFPIATIQGHRLSPLILTFFLISLFFFAEGLNFQWRIRKWLMIFPPVFLFVVIFPQSQPDLVAWNRGSHRYLYFPGDRLAIGDGSPVHWSELLRLLKKYKSREIRILPFPGSLSVNNVNQLFHQLHNIGVKSYFLPEDCWKKGANCWASEGHIAFSSAEPAKYSGLAAGDWLTFNVGEKKWIRVHRSSSERLEIFTPSLTVCVDEEETDLSACGGQVQFLRSHSLLFIHQKRPYLLNGVVRIQGNQEKNRVQILTQKEPGAGF